MTNVAGPDEIRRHRRRLIVPLAIAVLFLGGYTLFWFQGARIMRQEIASWAAAERADGREVAHGEIRVRGFPGSLRAEVADPRWADPGAWSWSGETLYVITEPMNPRRLLLTPRGEQRIRFGGRDYALRADDLRIGLAEGSVAFDASGVTAESGEIAYSLGAGRANWSDGEAGTALLLSVGQLSIDTSDAAYAVPQLNAALSAGPTSGLGLDAFEGAVAPGDTGEEGGVDRPVLLSGQGRVGVDDAGYPDGRMTVTVRNAGALAPLLVAAGVIPESQSGLVGMAVTGFTGAEGEASLPLAFADGRLRVGGFAVADLPRVSG